MNSPALFNLEGHILSHLNYVHTQPSRSLNEYIEHNDAKHIGAYKCPNVIFCCMDLCYSRLT